MNEQNEPSSQPPKHVEQRVQTSAGHPVTPGQQTGRKKSVFQYITILFAAAFVLLLFTFLMERRQNELLQQQNQEQIDNLQQSVSAVQSLQDLYDENAALKEKVSELTDQVSQLEDHARELQGLADANLTALNQTKQAMDWFWQIDEAYVREKYSLCRRLIGHLEDAGLVDALPKESATDNHRFSPYARYQEIYAAVF